MEDPNRPVFDIEAIKKECPVIIGPPIDYYLDPETGKMKARLNRWAFVYPNEDESKLDPEIIETRKRWITNLRSANRDARLDENPLAGEQK